LNANFSIEAVNAARSARPAGWSNGSSELAAGLRVMK